MLSRLKSILRYGLAGLVLAPFYLFSFFRNIKIGCLPYDRLGHLSMNTELFLRRQKIHGKDVAAVHVFLSGTPCNRQLLEMFKRHLFIIESELAARLYKRCLCLLKRTRLFQPLPNNSAQYYEFNNAGPSLCFTKEEETQGRRFLDSLGIGPESWFVCLFARDKSYLRSVDQKKDWSYHDYRNAHIGSYLEACEYIVSCGGYVIRVGFPVEEPLITNSPRVIDYSSEHRTDFLDVYLPSKCKFFLGTTSGMSDMPQLFDVPRIGTNYLPVCEKPMGKHCLYIPKIIRQRASGEPVPYRVFLECETERDFYDGHRFKEMGFVVEDNSSRDILNITVEMNERLDGVFRYTDEDERLLQMSFEMFKRCNVSHGNRTPVGIMFLREHQELFS